MKLGKDVSELRESNNVVVLSLIERHGPITRSKLAHLSSLSRATVSNILDDLAREDLIVFRAKDESTGGRQPELFELNPQARLAIGVDLGVHRIKAIVTDLKAKILAKKEIDSDYHGPDANIIPQAVRIIDMLLASSGVIKEKVIGVGISFPGTIDNDTGIIYDSPNIGGVGVSLKNSVSNQIDLPVFVDNDANLAALAEWWFGDGQGKKYVLYIFADHGTGCGLVINGEIYRGANHTASDVGHTTIDINGKRCHCGNYGCVETYTSFKAVVSRFEDHVRKGALTALIDDSAPYKEGLTVEKIIDAAKRGDSLASSVIEETGRILGIACANLVNLYDPEIIIVGGGLARAGEQLLEPFSRLVRTRSKAILRDKLEIIQSRLEPDACAIGGATLVIENLFRKGIEACRSPKTIL